MWVRDQRLPISSGSIVGALKAGLTAGGFGANLSGGTKLPTTKTARMFTVRDDSGPVQGRVQRRRQGVNVWAPDPVEAEKMALEGVRICQAVLPGSGPIVATSDFAGPFEIPEDTPYVVGGKNLTNYYFSFVCSVVAAQVEA